MCECAGYSYTMSRPKKPTSLAIVGPLPSEIAAGTALVSTHQILEDAQSLLAKEVEGLAAQADLPTETPEDLERAGALAKMSLARMDALSKALKIAANLREEKAAAGRDKVAGQDLSKMTDAQLKAFAAERMSGGTVIEAGPAEFTDEG